MRKKILISVIFCSLIFCMNAAASEGASGEQPSVFGGSYAESVWTVVAFLILLALLTKVAWKPLLENLKKREDHIKEQIESAENTRKNAETILNESKHQAGETIRHAAERAQMYEKDMVEKASKQVATIKQKAKTEIKHAKTAAVEELWENVGKMLLSVSSEVIGRNLTSEDNERLIHESIEKIKQSERATR